MLIMILMMTGVAVITTMISMIRIMIVIMMNMTAIVCLIDDVLSPL